MRPDLIQAPVKRLHLQGSDTPEGQKRLWYFSFGANMDPHVLQKARQVQPSESHPCIVEGYTLAFTHRGVPYTEPSFANIEPLQWDPPAPTVQMADSTHGRQAGSDRFSDRVYHSAQGSQACSVTSTDRSSDSTQGRQGSSAQPGMAAMYSTPSLATATRLQASAEDHSSCTNSDLSRKAKPGSNQHSMHLSGITSQLNGITNQLNGITHLTANHTQQQQQQVTVHGVAHQITRAEMDQVRRTELGGGNPKCGYFEQVVWCTVYGGQRVPAVVLLTHPHASHRMVSMHQHT